MNTTHSIIMYRNPLEQQFWESGMAFPLMVAMFVFFVVFLGTYKSMELIFGSWKIQRANWPTFVAGAIACTAAVATMVLL